MTLTFFNDNNAQKSIKDNEYLLNEKQSKLDNYIEYVDIACELGKVDKVQVIEIVRNKKRQQEPITKLLD
ncbi:MAG: hypothetical protein ACRD8K_09030 [Nitrososphaeraceae archaeon]